jgi:hypothetical protein
LVQGTKTKANAKMIVNCISKDMRRPLHFKA